MYPCLASRRRKISEIAEQRTICSGRVAFRYLRNVSICVRVVDFVQGENGGEFLVNETIDHPQYCFVTPVFEGFPELQMVQYSYHQSSSRAVPRELALKGVCRIGFYGDMSSLYAAPFLLEVAMDPCNNLAPRSHSMS